MRLPPRGCGDGTPPLYGWIVLRARNLAYECTTDPRGEVVVEEVPVEKIFPVCNLPDEHGAVEDGGHASDDNFASDPVIPHVGPYSGTDLRKLQSLPGAEKVILIIATENLRRRYPEELVQGGVFGGLAGENSLYSMYKVNVTTDPDVAAA